MDKNNTGISPQLSKFIGFVLEQRKMGSTGTAEQVVERFNALLAEGIDITKAREDGTTLLHALGTSQLFLQFTPELIDVIKRAVQLGCSLTAQDNEGNTPMHTVVYPIGVSYNEHFFNVAITIGGTAALHIRNNEGDTPLHRYAKRGRIEFWNAVFEHAPDTDPYIKNNEGHTPQEAAVAYARSGLTKSGYDQLIKRMAKTLEKIPRPEAKQQPDSTLQPESEGIWKINEEEKGQHPRVREQLIIPVEKSLFYSNIFPVDDQSAIITTNNYFLSLNLLNGSVRWKQRRYQMDGVRYQTAQNGIWYAGIDDDGTTGAIIAIDPLKAFDPNTGQSVWKAIIGTGGSSQGPCLTSDIAVTPNHVFFNASSAFMCVDNQKGKLLWRARPKGREWGTPVVWGGHVYTSCKVGKNYVLAAFDIQTGAPVEKENIPTPYALAKQLSVPKHFPPRWFRCHKPLIHNDTLIYFTHECILVGIDLPTKKTVFEIRLSDKYNPYWTMDDMEMFIDSDNTLHLLATGHTDIIARVDLATQTLLPEPDYVFDKAEKDFYQLRHLTKDFLYALKQDKEENECHVCITSRTTGKDQYNIKLPYRKTRHADETFKSILTHSGILYTYRYFENEGEEPYIEILMIY